MKRTFTLLTIAAIAIAAQAGSLHKAPVAAAGTQNTRVAKETPKTTTPRALRSASKAKLTEEIPDGMAAVTLAADDVWGDGSGYQMLLDSKAEAYGTIIPENGGLTTSGDASEETYAAFDYKIPENADGKLSTENIIIASEATIFVPAGIYDYCITNPTPGDRVWIASGENGRRDDFEIEAGVSYTFTVSLGGTNDKVDITIDYPDAPQLPETADVTIVKNTATISWDATNAESWSFRFRPKAEDSGEGNLFWDFEDIDQLNDWLIYDADGDGETWGYGSHANYISHSPISVLVSASYDNDLGPLTPDNWVFTPEVSLDGTLSLWACGQDANYSAEHFAVYVGPTDFESIEEFTQISEEIVASAEMTEYTFDLSEYAGEKGRIAIRHFNCTDMFLLNIDDVSISYGPTIAWEEIEGLTEPAITLADLEYETDYEYQIKAINTRGATDWSESATFTTEAEGSGVEAINAAKAGSEQWYSITGVRLSGKPNVPGIYLKGNKKVAITR